MVALAFAAAVRSVVAAVTSAVVLVVVVAVVVAAVCFLVGRTGNAAVAVVMHLGGAGVTGVGVAVP